MYYTSDTHFGHRNVLKFCADSRPYNTVEQMDADIMAKWNDVVGVNQEVWHLGDFSFHRDEETNQKIFDSLHGRKHLIIGNHDGTDIKALGWESVSMMKIIRHDKKKITLCHYPMVAHDKSHRNTPEDVVSIMLYGHVHSMPAKPFPTPNVWSHDVGWDRNRRMLHIDELFAHFASPFL